MGWGMYMGWGMGGVLGEPARQEPAINFIALPGGRRHRYIFYCLQCRLLDLEREEAP